MLKCICLGGKKVGHWVFQYSSEHVVLQWELDSGYSERIVTYSEPSSMHW